MQEGEKVFITAAWVLERDHFKRTEDKKPWINIAMCLLLLFIWIHLFCWHISHVAGNAISFDSISNWCVAFAVQRGASQAKGCHSASALSNKGMFHLYLPALHDGHRVLAGAELTDREQIAADQGHSIIFVARERWDSLGYKFSWDEPTEVWQVCWWHWAPGSGGEMIPGEIFCEVLKLGRTTAWEARLLHWVVMLPSLATSPGYLPSY